MSYKYLSITERELIAIYRAKSRSICQIAKLLGRHKSTISRELARNNAEYLPSKAKHAIKGDGKNVARIIEEHYRSEQIVGRFNRDAIRKLRHKGKRRRSKGYMSNRGKIPISHELKERPIEATQSAWRLGS